MKITATAQSGFSPQLMHSVSIMRMSAPSLVQFLSQHNNPCLITGNLPTFYEETKDIRRQLHQQCTDAMPAADERPLLQWLVECVDDDGFLYLPDDLPLPADIINDGVRRLQAIAPAGIAARSAAERLLLQLQQCAASPARTQAELLINNHWQWLHRKRWDKLPRRLRTDALALIESLPPVRLAASTPPPSLPDIMFVHQRGLWKAQVAAGSCFNTTATRNGTLAEWREAKAITAAIAARRRWLLIAGQYAADRQSMFFQQDTGALQILPLKKAAADLKISPAMLSHIICGKRGIFYRGEFALKYLYGNTINSTVIQYKIQQMIASEIPHRPLSDEKLRLMLQNDGMPLARRTVAKHRLLAGFAAAARRKRITH